MTTFSGILVINHSKATILQNNYKEVIDHVWQIVYRDFLDSSGNFEKSNWITLRKEFLAKKYSDRVIGLVGGKIVFDEKSNNINEAYLKKIYS